MCDPVSLSIASTVAGIAGTAVNSLGAYNAQKRQKREVQSWAAQQRLNRQREQQRQEEYHQQAMAAQQQGLAEAGPDAQAKGQAEEEKRLSQYLAGEGDNPAAATPAAPVSASDQAIASGKGDPATVDLAKKISEATASARQRIGALARVSSYGGSSGGLDQLTREALRKSGGAIDMANTFRRSSLGAYNTEQAVEPVQVSYTGSPLADIFSGLAQVGSMGIGSGIGKAQFGAFPKAPKAPTFIGPAKPLPLWAGEGSLF